MVVKWEDRTSYRQGERGNVEARIWYAEVVPRLRVSVHRIHRLDGWYVSCHDLGFVDRRLGEMDVDSAKEHGLAVMVEVLGERLKVYQAAIKAIMVPR